MVSLALTSPPDFGRRPRPPVVNALQDLRRVFDHLACHVVRLNLSKLISQKNDRYGRIKEVIDNPDSAPPVLCDSGRKITKYQAPNELKMLGEEIQEIKIKEKKIFNDPNKNITVRDLDAALRSLGMTCSKKQLEYMIWEVDENLDRCVDWSEFQLMFQRNTTDQTGLEPFALFNIVQFMTYDEDFKGHITEDDTMSTLFARHGRDNLESQMNKLFGDQLKSCGGEGILTLDQYLKAVSVRVVRKCEIDYTVAFASKKDGSREEKKC